MRHKIKTILFSKSYIGALLFALALWAYTALSGHYSTLVNMPLKIILPENRAFEEPPPKSILLEVKGTGWNLFNFLFFNNSKQVIVDLSDSKIIDSEFSVQRSNLLKGIQGMEKVELSDILTESITVHTGKVTTYGVKVEPDIRVEPADGFTLVGNVKVYPDMVEIRGNDKIVSKIQSWKTKYAFYEDVNKSFSESIELSDSLDGIVNINLKKVDFIANVQQTCEITFNEIKVNIRGGTTPKNHVIYPDFVTITFRGGINEIAELNPDKLSVSINYADIINDKTGILIPKIEYPGSVKIINVEPKYLINHKVVRTNTLAEN